MIGVGAPWILGLAMLGALGTVVLHFLSVRRPSVLLLPTMRFLPDRPVRAVSRSARPSDLKILMMRVAALLLIGIALAGVTWRGNGASFGRIVVLQRNASEDVALVRSALQQSLQSAFLGDTSSRVIVIDSVAHLLSESDSRAFNMASVAPVALPAASATGMTTLTALLLAGVRAAGALVAEQRSVDQVELVVIAPLAASSIDAALPEVRRMWPGTIRLIDTRMADTSSLVEPSGSRHINFRGKSPSDAVSAGFGARGWLAGAAPPASTAFPNIDVEWPANGVPEGWTTTAPDTVGAVSARGSALVFPFVRRARVPDAVLKQARAIAWWSDGEIAAIEVPTASSCTRHVGIDIPASSDVLLGSGARPLLLALTAPCGGDVVHAQPLSAETRTAIEAGQGNATASSFRGRAVVKTPWAALLLIIALALLSAEWWIRDQEERATRAVDDELTAIRKVA